MNAILDLKEQIRAVESELYELKRNAHTPDRLGSIKNEYLALDEKISVTKDEIDEDFIYIKRTYDQLLAVRSGAELFARKNPDQPPFDVFSKTHRAFLMLIELNKRLESKLSLYKDLLYRRELLVEKQVNKKTINEVSDKLKLLYKELQKKESQDSENTRVRNRIIDSLCEQRNTETKIRQVEKELEIFSDKKLLLSEYKLCPCGAKRIIRYKNNFFWGCSKYKSEEASKHPSINYVYLEPHERKPLEEKFRQLEILKNKNSTSSIQSLSKNEIDALYGSIIELGEYPKLDCGDNYTNYLFQSIALPGGISISERFNELRDYSRFRIFTKLPKNTVDDKTRTAYSLALRLMNRGIAVNANAKTEARIKRCFGTISSHSFTSELQEYLTYSDPCGYGKGIKGAFAKRYFPEVLGSSWASYVYAQMPLELLLSKQDKKRFVGGKVDFLICKGAKRIVVEIDESNYDATNDSRRDMALKGNGYEILRFTINDVNQRPEYVLRKLNDHLNSASGKGSLTEYSTKRLVATKIAHQVAIAIVKMLEEGHIPSCSNLELEINTDLFNAVERRLILIIAADEAKELVEKLAQLYGVNTNINFFDENAEKYQIKIGDGDDRRNSIVIRDVTLPLDYLCSLHEFSLVMPNESSVTEDLLEYFLSYIFGYSSFRDGQFEAIKRTLCRKESIVLLPTGSGKSVIYQLSSMLLPGITVVISPLRALIEDQVTNLASRGINNVAYIYSTEKDERYDMQEKTNAIISNHSATMLYIAPERMQIPKFRNFIREQLTSNNFCLIAIDEAHCVSEWGHDFRAAYLQIGRSSREVFKKNNFEPKIIALTGTASGNVLRDVKRDLAINEPDAIIEPKSFDREELSYSVIPCSKEEKYINILTLLSKKLPARLGISKTSIIDNKGTEITPGLIFTINAMTPKDSSYDSWSLFNHLKTDIPSINVGTYFSKKIKGIDEKTWDSIIKSYAKEYKENKKQLLVATKAFGMGIDKPNIRYVIHNSLPSSIEQYYQEVGRAGRDRKHSECVLLFTSNGTHEKLLDPNVDWDDYVNQIADMDNDTAFEDDVSKLIYFHKNNFVGKDFERYIIFAVLHCLKNKTDSFTKLQSNAKHIIDLNEIYKVFLTREHQRLMTNATDEYAKKINATLNNIRNGKISCKITIDKTQGIKCNGIDRILNGISDTKLRYMMIGSILEEKPNDNNLLSYLILKAFGNDSLNDVAKAIVRLVTVGIIGDFEYDYTERKFTVHLESIEREHVKAKYLEFVNGYSRGRVDYEAMKLNDIPHAEGNGPDLNFIAKIVERYVDLVYDTVEKGRRRAIQSMHSLASEAAKISDPQKQDAYVRKLY